MTLQHQGCVKTWLSQRAAVITHLGPDLFQGLGIRISQQLHRLAQGVLQESAWLQPPISAEETCFMKAGELAKGSPCSRDWGTSHACKGLQGGVSAGAGSTYL